MRITLFALLLLLLSGCNPRLIPPPQAENGPAAAGSQAPLVTPVSEQERLTALAVGDLASRLSIDRQQVEVLLVEPIRWPDASLGCPSPGQVHAAMEVAGFKILLAVAGKQYIYHTDGGTQMILCSEDDLPLFPIKPGEIDDGQPWMPVE